MDVKKSERLTIATVFGIIGFIFGIVSEKWGIARGKVPETITWDEFFSERIDNVLIITGFCFILAYVFNGLFRDNSVYLICSNCQTPYDKSNLKNELCPKCLVMLEPVEGFYDRHPELKKHNNDS